MYAECRDAEGRKKEAKQHSTPKAVTFPKRDTHLEEVPNAVSRACSTPRTNFNGLDLVSTIYSRGSTMHPWMKSPIITVTM